MSTNPIAGAASAATTATKSSKTQQALDTNFANYLTLLTTQLQHQDPLDPQDSSEFTKQLTDLNSLQAQIDTNGNLETLISLFSSSQINNVVNYIGRAIEAVGNKGMLASYVDQSGNTQRGVPFSYDLAREATSATITITNATNGVVYNGPVTTKQGRNEVLWDGTNNLTGQEAADGVYSYSISAKDAAGNAIGVTTHTTGIVTAVDTKDGKVTLVMGDIRVNTNDVTAIKTAQNLL